MATKFLINAIRLGGIGQLWPGSSYDDVREAPLVALIESGGGLLWDSGDAYVFAAAPKAQAVRLRGGSPGEAESVMQSAVQESQTAAQQGANTVAPTTSTVQSATTGISTQANSDLPLVRGMHEVFVYPPLAGVTLATINESAGSGSVVAQPTHARTVDVTFDAGWEGGDVAVQGNNPKGQPIEEIYTSAPGTTVNGVKAFVTISAIQNGAPSVAAVDGATAKTGAQLGVGGPASSFLLCSVDGVREAFAASSTTNGTFSTTTALDGTQFVEVWYAQEETIAGHTHDITDPGHTHTGDAHTHTLT